MRFRPVLTLCLLSLLGGCSGCSVGYYAQAINGHFDLMSKRRAVQEVIDDPATDEATRRVLASLQQARRFATETLGLPDNDSYSDYAATGREAVTWNVVAAGEFSLQPYTWCFPVAGCVSYRGYFDRTDAEAYAAQLEAEGFDVTVGGASAYSTLGWFEDPVLDTMLARGELGTVGTLIHELAHQVLYIKGDSGFNEAFASFVEVEGLRQWLQDQGRAEDIRRLELSQARSAEFNVLLAETRDELLELYGSKAETEVLRLHKASIFSALRARYEVLKQSWGGYGGYDRWFDREINNARLVSVATYRQWVPAFRQLYVDHGEDMEAFLSASRALSEQSRERRDTVLAELRNRALESPG